MTSLTGGHVAHATDSVPFGVCAIHRAFLPHEGVHVVLVDVGGVLQDSRRVGGAITAIATAR